MQLIIIMTCIYSNISYTSHMVKRIISSTAIVVYIK